MTERILDVKIDQIETEEVLENIKGFLISNKQHYIVTLNPEMIVESQYNSKFKDIINKADIIVPDGIGILFAYSYLHRDKLPEKITGIDLIYKICQQDYIKSQRIFFLGAGEGIAKVAMNVLSKKYNYLNIVGAEEGVKSNRESTIDSRELIQKINTLKPDIIFVAFGAPKQEIWINENIKKIPSIKLAIGVGGSFDFISGRIKRAPQFFQKNGLEWLYRLSKEPKRIKRIYNATIKFGILVLISKLKK